jgi:4-hydroxy-4-methyl-2-oxoglutarate aldolase
MMAASDASRALATVRTDFERPTPALLRSASELPTSTIHEGAGRIGALPAAIEPLEAHFRVCGPAVTVHSPAGDNLWLHRAIYLAQPGDVLVVDVEGGYEFGYWGEIMSCAARQCGLAGLVINGCVRDGATLASSDFPVFARGLCMRGTGKDYGARGWINYPTLIEDVVVRAGDLIVGDYDGVVAIPRTLVADVVEKSVAREAKEASILKRLRQGERTLDIYNF